MSIERMIRRLADAIPVAPAASAARAKLAGPADEVTIRDRDRSSGRRSGRLGGTWQDPVWRRALADGIDVALGRRSQRLGQQRDIPRVEMGQAFRMMQDPAAKRVPRPDGVATAEDRSDARRWPQAGRGFA